MGQGVFVHFRASTTIGIASEVLRLALARAVLLSETITPVRVGWPKFSKVARYPTRIYHEIRAPRLASGSGIRYAWSLLKAFLAQIVNAVCWRLSLSAYGYPLSPEGQYGLFFNAPLLYQRVLGKQSKLGALKSVAKAVRAFGPVDISHEVSSQCAAQLPDLGVGPGDWFVCLHVRTSLFHGDNADYRNAQFHNYEATINYILGLGGKVVRMGDSGSGIVTCPKQGLIDYPNTRFKSEQMDLYLIKNCRFYIGTTSGILDTAYLFQTPTLCVNSLHFDFRSPNLRDRVLFKRVNRKRDSRSLSFDQAMACYDDLLAVDWSDRYEFIENTGEEILDAAKEFLNGLYSRAVVTTRQAKARRLLIRNWFRRAKNHGSEFSMQSASIAFSRCQIADSCLERWSRVQ